MKNLAKIHDLDRISLLPDDILIFIISQLPLREATATSLLSTRWRRLYTYATRLDLPSFEPNIGSLKQYLEEMQEVKISNYVHMINHILDSHMNCRMLKEFSVRMLLLEEDDIERWLEFALTREVEIIDIKLHPSYNCLRKVPFRYCTFGLLNMIRKNGGELLPGLKSLTKLSLSNVQVEDQEIEFLLSNSPLLESLSISYSERLKNVLIVCRSELKLKHLGISNSSYVESVEVCDMINLISLSCYELPYSYVLKLNNVPKLSDFTTCNIYDKTIDKVLPAIPSTIYDQLQRLKLHCYTSFFNVDISAAVLPELANVKHLELEVQMYSLTYPLFLLVEACPSLEIVEIKFLWVEDIFNFQDAISVRFPKKKISPDLKILKLSGYLGCCEELRFAQFIMMNAMALKEVIVEPCDISHYTQWKATFHAYRQLLPIKSNSVNLVIGNYPA